MRPRLWLLVCFPLLAACGPEAVINQTVEVPNGQWVVGEGPRFEFTVDDPSQPYTYFLLVRNSGDYAYRNLHVRFKTYFPNNTYRIDTVNCPLADPSGRWFGSGLGDMLDNSIEFKRMEPLPMAGTYYFEIEHAMRPDTVNEIYDVGLRIEKSSN